MRELDLRNKKNNVQSEDGHCIYSSSNCMSQCPQIQYGMFNYLSPGCKFGTGHINAVGLALKLN